MTQTWKQNAKSCIGAHVDGDVQAEIFSKSWRGRISALYWRVPIFLWAFVTLSWSAATFWGSSYKYLLYMTHWGLLLIVLESIFGIIVAGKCSRYTSGTSTLNGLDSPEPVHVEATNPDYGSFKDTLTFERAPFHEKGGKRASTSFDDIKATLPWYLKVYWVLYNVTIPVAFLITVFYWVILKASVKKVNYAPNPILDVMLHGINSVVMLVELVMSGHPSRLLHIMQPLYFALAYLIFTLIYYVAGGLDPWGNAFIYPVIDWSKPEQTLVVVALTGLFLALMHILTVAIATARDIIARRCFNTPSGVYNDGFEA